MNDDNEVDFGVREYPPWKEGVKQFLESGFKHDDVIEHAWFWSAVGMEYPDKKTMCASDWEKLQLRFLKQFQSLVKTLLLEHSIHLESEPGVGYRVLPPADQAPVAYEKLVDQMRKLLRHTADRLQHTEVGLLSVAQQSEYQATVNKMAMVAQAYRSVRRMPTLPVSKEPVAIE